MNTILSDDSVISMTYNEGSYAVTVNGAVIAETENVAWDSFI